jgi:hypothetical protein
MENPHDVPSTSSTSAAAPRLPFRARAGPSIAFCPQPGEAATGSWAMPHVTSEAIAQIEYDAASRTLFVRFTSGEWYGYAGVPASVHRAFVAAESHGRFFHDHILGRYPHTGPLSL